MGPVVQDAQAEDLPAVATIYEREVLTGIATFDEEPPPMAVWETRLSSEAAGDHFLVARDAGLVLGFAYSSAYRPRPAYDRTRETTVYLAERAQGQGLGRRLYDELLARLRADEMHRALGVVALPNPASEALHRACGFEPVARLSEVGFKFGRWIDTAYYQLRL